MRDLKFRALKRNSSEWVYFQAGSLNLDQEDTYSQFTGLTDKNGVEIYEGDIVKFGIEVYEVVYEGDKDYPAFEAKGWDGDCNGLSYFQNEAGCEVIGNIHENPALLTAPSPDKASNV